MGVENETRKLDVRVLDNLTPADFENIDNVLGKGKIAAHFGTSGLQSVVISSGDRQRIVSIYAGIVLEEKKIIIASPSIKIDSSSPSAHDIYTLTKEETYHRKIIDSSPSDYGKVREGKFIEAGLDEATKAAIKASMKPRTHENLQNI